MFTDRSGVRTVRLVRPLRLLVGEISGVIVQLIQGRTQNPRCRSRRTRLCLLGKKI
jgi:hypothetical protein